MIHASLTVPADTPADSGSGTLDALRRRGVQLWAASGWVALVIMLVANAILQAGVGRPLFLIGCAVNAGPTVMAARGRHDGEARMIVGSLAALLPAMLVFLLRGHPWQMDAHMYFFVSMAALVVFADWRPLLAAAALIAGHHLLLEWLAPAWLFAGSGDFERVLFHAAAVAIQCGALVFLARRLEQLVEAQDASVATARALATAAEFDRLRALAAMEQTRATETRAAVERQAHQQASAREAAIRRDELVELAETFERSVSRVIDAIGEAARGLEGSSERLDATVAGTDRVADAVATGAGKAAGEIALVAASVRELSASIQTIAATADRQIDLAGQARGEAKRSVETIGMLEERTAQIEGLAEDIRGIAGRTKLLALNATIEAARAGDAGRGFTIVAGEVKTLAGESARASGRISELLAGIRAGVLETSSELHRVNGAIGDVASAANGIAAAVEAHQATARNLATSTDRAAGASSDTGEKIASVAAVAGTVTTLAADVRHSAIDLTSCARELRGSADGFLSFLRGDQAATATPATR